MTNRERRPTLAQFENRRTLTLGFVLVLLLLLEPTLDGIAALERGAFLRRDRATAAHSVRELSELLAEETRNPPGEGSNNYWATQLWPSGDRGELDCLGQRFRGDSLDILFAPGVRVQEYTISYMVGTGGRLSFIGGVAPGRSIGIPLPPAVTILTLSFLLACLAKRLLKHYLDREALVHS